MTIVQTLDLAVQSLKHKKTKFPQLEAEILLSHIIKKPREYLFSHPEAELTKKQASSFWFQISERIKGMPIAYLTGEKEFYGLKFLVNKNVLVPRPETELMVEEVVKRLNGTDINTIIIDVGTGSGCIITSLAGALIFNFQFFPPQRDPAKAVAIFNKFSIFNLPRRQAGFQFYGTDISKKALVVAKKNAKHHNVGNKIKFINGDLLEPLIPKLKIDNCKLKIILANLPYLTPAQIKNSPTIKFDPKLALAAGPDGLKYYRRLFKQINKLSRLSGIPPKAVAKYILFCEIDPSQKTSIKRLAKRLLPPHEFTIKKDLRGHSRLVIIKSK